MNITVFGSSKPLPGEPDYQTGLLLGRMIAEAGHAVITGGYMGAMGAVSQGAAEAGGHVIGVTCVEIERWRNNGPNPWIKEEWRCETLIERLQKLIYGCQAVIVLPGGQGTLVEISLLWNLLVIGAIPRRPVAVYGAGWRAVIDAYLKDLRPYFNPDDWQWLTFTEDIHHAFQIATNHP
ncbi:MAG: LOG family protein [Chloroflexota bacterium]|jgi:uncharacterized protein (TIGR00725 family)